MTPQQEQPLQKLITFLQGQTALLLVIGEAGSGKTKLVNTLSAHRFWRMHILQLQGYSDLDEERLLREISDRWGISLSTSYSFDQGQLNELLDKITEKNESYLLIVDDAHKCPLSTLIALSYLAIHQPEGTLNLRIVLLGEPSLIDKVKTLLPANTEWPLPQIVLEVPSEEEERIEEENIVPAFETVGAEEESAALSMRGGFQPTYSSGSQLDYGFSEKAPTPAYQSAGASSAFNSTSPHFSETSPSAHQEMEAEDPLGLKEVGDGNDEPTFYEKHKVKIISTFLLVATLLILYYYNNRVEQTPSLMTQSAEPTQMENYAPEASTADIPASAPPESMAPAASSVENATASAPNNEINSSAPETVAPSTVAPTTPATEDTSTTTSSVEEPALPPALLETPSTPAVTALAEPTIPAAKKALPSKPAYPPVTAHHKTSTPTTAAAAYRHYTLQLMGRHEKAPLQNFIKTHHLEKQLTIRHTHYEGRDWYVLTYGQFATPKEALEAKKKLPTSLKTLKPWVRSLSTL